MPTREEIVQKALTLSAEDRAYVADVIEQSPRQCRICDIGNRGRLGGGNRTARPGIRTG
jgi:hypothetical protein